MNRNDEFFELKNDLPQAPVELQYTATKAITKAKKSKRRSLLLKTPLISFCSLAVAFVILVNLFPAVALAMSNTLGLKELVKAVAFNPNLKRAVEHDYYQEIGETETQEDVKVTVDYMILDAGHVSLFFHVNAPVKAGLYHFDLTNSKNEGLSACLLYDTMYETGKLEEIQIELTDDNYKLPEELIFHITVNKDENFQASRDAQMAVPEDIVTPAIAIEPKSSGTDYNFTFKLHPDHIFSQTVKSILINHWMEIKGQRICLNKLNIYPSYSRLYLSCDSNNSTVLEGLNIYFKDNRGNLYTPIKNGISATDETASENIGSLYYDSSYFMKANRLTLFIDGISSIDKDKQYGEIDYSAKSISNLPEGVSVDSMELVGSTLNISLKIKSNKSNHYDQILSGSYYDKGGKQYDFGTWGTGTTNDSKTYSVCYKISDYEDNKYKVKWIYSPMQPLETPITIEINK